MKTLLLKIHVKMFNTNIESSDSHLTGYGIDMATDLGFSLMNDGFPRFMRALARDMTDSRCCVVSAGDTSQNLFWL